MSHPDLLFCYEKAIDKTALTIHLIRKNAVLRFNLSFCYNMAFICNRFFSLNVTLLLQPLVAWCQRFQEIL